MHRYNSITSAHNLICSYMGAIKAVAFALCLLIISIYHLPRSLAAPTKVSEYDVKAAFIYNFAKFTDWPDHVFEDNDSPLNIGILGEDWIVKTIKNGVDGKTVHGRRKVQVNKVTPKDELHDLHILFITAGKEKHLEDVLSELEKKPVLTVGEIDRFAHKGGMINLVEKNNKLTLEINLKSCQASKIKISSKVLRLATIVEK